MPDSEKKETNEVNRRRSDRSLGEVLPKARRGRAMRAVRIRGLRVRTPSATALAPAAAGRVRMMRPSR
jgi:hypothetical protein